MPSLLHPPTPPNNLSTTTSQRLASFFFAAVVGCWLSSLPVAGCLADDRLAREPNPTSWRGDAELTDVQFIDVNQGWVVGDAGTILRTRDGGITWSDKTANRQFRKDNVRLTEKFANLRNKRTDPWAAQAASRIDSSPYSCRFESVHFVDANHGWAVGGLKLPYVDRTRAIALRTRDGGLSWQSVDDLGLPRLRKVYFSNNRQGIVIGDSGNVFTGGIFQSNNGGKSWSGKLLRSNNSWLEHELLDHGSVVIDNKGQLGRLKNDRYQKGVLIGGTNQRSIRFRDIAMVDEKLGVAVGTNGAIYKTNNSGLSWNAVSDSRQPQLQSIDWRAATVAGDTIKLAGNPGSVVASYRIADDQIQLHSTPITSKLNKLCFVNANQGWAVGDFGIVLSTADGGQTWKRLRGSTRGLAVLAISPRSDQVPVDLLTNFCVDQNLNCGSVVIRDRFQQFEVARQAAARVGVMTHQLLAAPNELNSEQQLSNVPSDAHAKLSSATNVPVDSKDSRNLALAALVRCLRASRPLVVVSQARQTLDRSLTDDYQLIARAIQLAADPDAFPEQLQIGLKTHYVSRLLVQDPLGQLSIPENQVLIQSGVLLQDQAALSRALLGKPVLSDSPNHYRLIDIRAGARQTSPTDFFGGLSINRLPKRLVEPKNRGTLTAIRFANESQRQLKEFINFEVRTPQDIGVWRLKLRRFLGTMEVDHHQGSAWMMRLAEAYLANQKTALAIETTELLLSRFPNSPYTIAVATWLARQYSSHEFGRVAFDDLIRQGIVNQNGQASTANRIANRYATQAQVQTANGQTTLTWQPLTPNPSSTSASNSQTTVQQAGAAIESPVDRLPDQVPEFFHRRLHRSAQLLSLVGQQDPDFAAGLYCHWLEAQLAMRLSVTGAAKIESPSKRYRQLAQPTDQPTALQTSIIARARQQVAWLQQNKQISNQQDTDSHPDPADSFQSTTCLLIEQRPFLDGRLQEPFWPSAPRLPAETSTPTLESYIQFCRDQENLYVAVVCKKSLDLKYPTVDQSTRQRDGLLSHVDRVEFDFDVDSDYNTSFRFAVDCLGRAQESCQWLTNWDPDWFVSHHQDRHQWVCEIAIPLTAIAAAKTRPGDDWTVHIRRRTALDTTHNSAQPAKQSVFQHQPLDDPGWRIQF